MGENFRPWARRAAYKLKAKDPTGFVDRALKAMEDRAIEREKGIKVNDFFWYNFDDRYPEDISIHISGVGTLGSAKRGFVEGFEEGLDFLADKFTQNDEEFANKKRIVGFSDFVVRNKNWLRRRGFEVPESEIGRVKEGWGFAIMERDECIKRPWRKTNE